MKEVKITGLATDEEGFTGKDFDLEMEYEGYLHKIAYSKLTNIKASEQTMEAFEIWDFWVGK